MTLERHSTKMAVVGYGVFLAILLCILNSPPATPQPEFPFLPPLLLGGVCNLTHCGRGSCVPSFNNPLGFECECDEGWTQEIPIGNLTLKFLPCVIPNCTQNYTCSDQARTRDFNRIPDLSSLHPCYYTDCGGGICNRTSAVSHTCICEDGFYNLLNNTLYPCYRQCTYGNDCPALKYNTSTSAIDPNPFYRFNHGSSLSSGADFACWFAMVVTLARLIWMYT